MTEIASFRGLRSPLVVDINYDEHTPAWGEQTLRGGIPLGGGGRADDSERGASIDVDWDPDEPPTRLWSSESMRLPMPSRAQPKAAASDLPPRSSDARITGVRTRADLPTFKPLPPLPEFTPLPDLGPLPTFKGSSASLPEFTPLPAIARLPPVAPLPEYSRLDEPPPPRAARRATPEMLPPARASKSRRRQTLPPPGPVQTDLAPAPEPRPRRTSSLERTQISHAPAPAPEPPQYGGYDAFEGDAAEQPPLPRYTRAQPTAAPAFERTLLSHGEQSRGAPIPGGLVERAMLAHGQQRRPAVAPPIPAAARVERGPELLPELAHNRNYFPGLTDDPPELTRGDRKWLKPALGAGAVAVLGGLGMWMFGGPASVDLVVETTPADAKVLLDGKPLSGSQSPYTLDKVLVGPHVLSVQKPGFNDHSETLTLNEHEKKHTLAVKLDAVAAKNKADLAVSSLPPGAAIIVDGQPSGLSTPAAVNLNYGYHTVQLRLDGYAEGEKAIKVPDENSLSLSLEAAQPAAAARAARGSHAALSGDDAAAKRSELRAAKIRTHYRANRGMPPRPEDAEIIRAADPDSEYLTMYEGNAGSSSHSSSSSSRSFASSSSSRASHAKDADASSAFGSSKPAAASGGRTGTLQVNSRPWAEIYLDGQHLGHTPLRGAEVPAGKHTLKLTNPGMNMSKTLSITVAAGQTLTKIETLSE